MERDEDLVMIKRVQANAPNLKPIKHVVGPDFICCSEVPKKRKPKLCESLINSYPKPKINCYETTKSQSVPRMKPRPEPYERDILYRPIHWRCKPSTKVSKKECDPSLGAPIGLSKSSFSLNFLESKIPEQELQGFATILIAFAEYFITPEIEWDEKVLNRILLEGQRLYADSKSTLKEEEKLKEASIKRSFTLCGNTFDVIVTDPFVVGRVTSDAVSVPNLHWGLLKFFQKFQFCLLNIGNWYLMIWKNLDVYFVFDCFGRRSEDLKSDRKRGVSTLICLRFLDNVSHLILNLSGVKPDQMFTIRQLQIKSLFPCGGKPSSEIVDRSVQFEIISSDYALLRATLHLGSCCFKEISYRQSLPVAICALTNAKIDATPSWDSKVLDKIIKLGTYFYQQWTQCDISFYLTIQDVPNKFLFGQFLVHTGVLATAESGLWKCTPNFRNSDLSLALKRAFQQGTNLIIEMQGKNFAIWKKGTFYYVFDPYSHRCSLEKKKIVTASLRMCGTFDKLCFIFTQALLELYEESYFNVHVVKIFKIEELSKINANQLHAQVPCACTIIPSDDTQEAISLNESVVDVVDYDCEAEAPIMESDGADLDSPRISQIRIENYSDLRGDFMEDSDEESEDDDEDDVDLDDMSDAVPFDESDDSDDDAPDPIPRKDKTKKKLTKQAKNVVEKDKSENTRRSASDKEKKRGKKRSHSESERKLEKTKRTKEEKPAKIKKQKTEVKTKEPKTPKEPKVAKERKKSTTTEEQYEDKHEENKPEEKKKSDEEKSEEKKKSDEEKSEQQITEANIEASPVEERPDSVAEPAEEPLPIINENIKKSVEKADGQEPEDSPPADQDSPTDQRRKSSKDETPADRRSTSKSLKTSNAPQRRQRHQRRKEQDGEDSSSDEIPRGRLPAGCIPNSYPGCTEDPQDMAVIGSENGSYESLCVLLKSAFRCADRVLTITPWGNYVAFRANGIFLIYDGLICNLRSIRHMDLSVGTAGLLCFKNLHELIKYIQNGKQAPRPTTSSKRDIVDQICSKYCSR